MTLVKAQLKFEDGDTIDVQFNPSELSITKASTWNPDNSTGRTAPSNSRYAGGKAATLSVKLLLDTTDSGEPVTTKTNKLQKLVEISTEQKYGYKAKKKAGRPLTVQFLWGEMVPFNCVCTNLKITYTYFDSSGNPLRAKADISLEQVNNPMIQKRQNPTSGTPWPHRVHTVGSGETLDRIASKHYGDPTQWRLIADANRDVVSDPMRVRPGTVIVIPDRWAHHG